jgi:hypothetical protein
MASVNANALRALRHIQARQKEEETADGKRQKEGKR